MKTQIILDSPSEVMAAAAPSRSQDDDRPRFPVGSYLYVDTDGWLRVGNKDWEKMDFPPFRITMITAQDWESYVYSILGIDFHGKMP